MKPVWLTVCAPFFFSENRNIRFTVSPGLRVGCTTREAGFEKRRLVSRLKAGTERSAWRKVEAPPGRRTWISFFRFNSRAGCPGQRHPLLRSHVPTVHRGRNGVRSVNNWASTCFWQSLYAFAQHLLTGHLTQRVLQCLPLGWGFHSPFIFVLTKFQSKVILPLP